MVSHKESCRCRRSDVKVFNYNDDRLRFALTSAHASQLYLCRYVDATMALRRSSRIKQSCCSGTGKVKQQEQKKLRSSSKAGKNTVPTEETQVEELTERDATGKTKQQEQKRLRSSSKAVKNTVPTEDTQVKELTEQHAKRAKASEQPAAATNGENRKL